MNRWSTEDFRAVTLFCRYCNGDIHYIILDIIHLSKSTGCEP